MTLTWSYRPYLLSGDESSPLPRPTDVAELLWIALKTGIGATPPLFLGLDDQPFGFKELLLSIAELFLGLPIVLAATKNKMNFLIF